MSRTQVVGADLDGDGIYDDPMIIVVPDQPQSQPQPQYSHPPIPVYTREDYSSRTFRLPSWKWAKVILGSIAAFLALPLVVAIFLFFYSLFAVGI